mgnify:CR=1 FL=1
MTNLDAIIDRYTMVKPEEVAQALTNVSNSFDEYYICEDGFKVVYNQVKGKATYIFLSNEDRPLEADVTEQQRDYLVKIKYWRSV